MTFGGIAYGPDAHVLVTFDDAELLAHDAQTEAPKWKATLDRPIVAVLFADPDALPGGGANPWRSQSSGRALVVVDAEGAIHGFDPALGSPGGKLGPVGKPVAVASGLGGVLAVATESRVYLWRNGEATELPCRASALAFSNDGGTIAIGEADGTLRFLSLAAGTSKPPAETFCAVVHGGVTDLVQHPDGTWLASGKSGLSEVTSTGARRLDAVPAKVSRLAFDTSGKRLAVQLSERSLHVYAWPKLTIEAEVTYPERLVRGLSFGPDDWLGVALDHGDGNKIDVVTSATHRTDTHPGRQHRSWLLGVRGKQSILSEKEAEEIRRMKTPFHTPKPEKPNGNGGRIGIGAGLSLALLLLRLCAAGSRSSSYTPPSYNYGTSSGYGSATTCDRACATQRIVKLGTECEGQGCEAQAKEALAGFSAGNCVRTKAALAKIEFPASSNDTRAILGRASLILANSGVTDACATGTIVPRTVTHPTLVVLEGKTAQPKTEEIPGANTLEGETPRSMWTAPDGTLFVVTMEGGSRRSFVHRRGSTGLWDVVATRRSPLAAQVWGRSATDVTIMDGDSIAHFDGTRTTELTAPSRLDFSLTGVDQDVFVIAEPVSQDDDDDGGVQVAHVHRRRGTTGAWTIETTPPSLVPISLWSGGGSVWASAANPYGDNVDDQHLLQRTSNGRWVERSWFGGKRPKSVDIKSVWVSPTGDAFVAVEGGVFRSSGGGTSWTKTGDPENVRMLWGRTSTDVYAATTFGLLHYDGKSWSKTAFAEPAPVVGGTATAVFVATTSD